jgi:hypothetical protein
MDKTSPDTYDSLQYIIDKFLIDHKKTCDSSLAIKKFNFPLGHWVEIIFLIGHFIVKVEEQISFLPLATFLCFITIFQMEAHLTSGLMFLNL